MSPLNYNKQQLGILQPPKVKKISYLGQKEYEKQSGHSEDFLDSSDPWEKRGKRDIKNNNYHLYLEK